MEFHVNKQPVFLHEMLLETELEQPVECDVLLPDYCEDIQKILKCTLQPTLTRQEVKENRLELEGVCVAAVWYRSPEGGLCRGEYRLPFVKTVELKAAPQCPLVWAQGLCGYVNCRAVSSRRLDIRGAVTLRAAVADVKEEQAVASAEGMGLQLRQTGCRGTRVVLQTERSLTLREEIRLPETKEPAAAVLRVDGSARLADCKVMAGRVVLRGECRVRFLYRTAGGSCETMELTLPVSQMVEAEGADDSCRCLARFALQTAGVELCADGEGRRLALTAELCAQVRLHRDYQALCSSDCYSTRYECSCRTRRGRLLELCGQEDRAFLYRDRMELPKGVDRITDLWCTLADWKVKQEGSDGLVWGKLNICLFGCQGDGDVEYYEKTVEFEERVPYGEGEGEVIFRPTLGVLGQSYSFGGEGVLEVRCELSLWGCIYRTAALPLICDITLDQSRPRQPEASRGIYLCRAEAGEALWDIARRYNTSVDAICAENDLTAPTLEQTAMLLVPVV